ncbi:MAG: sigma-54-dependent Fis family transcriptional regulator [Planctomycetes bacterium]|nr:sigma-54-dependent Fis family transcriptional regulator [Planctomycetota bacterium]
MSIQKILVVDDDNLSRQFLVEALKSLGYQVTVARDGNEGFEQVRTNPPDMVFTDLRMPGADGMQLVERLSKDYSGLPVAVITAHGTVETAVSAMRLGAADFLMKPCTADTLQLVVRRVEKTRKLERENEYLRAEMLGASSTVIAESPSMLETVRSAKRIAKSKGTVLVTGESGTGKERVAQVIHQESSRAHGPFIRVNCAALSETLLESELFGHERGAFTGAHKSREGRFELADGGTLLLDEIGEISPALQSKLLRVLEEEEFERVGGNTTIKVDVRVVATTNRDLSVEVKAGRFREDLYYRLHVLPIHIAPLRERPKDIAPLAKHFLAHYARSQGQPIPQISAGAEQRLLSWSWPGNVRELENVIQRAVVLMQGNALEATDLVFGAASGPVGVLQGGPQAAPAQRPLLANRPLADIEREAILETLASTGGNKTEAARRMGVSARTLSNKMKLWRQLGLVA